jgi:hypothetical protein
MDKSTAVRQLSEFLQLMEQAPMVKAGAPGHGWRVHVSAVVFSPEDVEALRTVLALIARSGAGQ